jgi:hypothetical protein
MPKINNSRTLNHPYREVSLLSFPDRKKRCKKKTATVCYLKEKKKRRLRVIKKIVIKKVMRVPCPPPEGQQLLQGLAGAIAEAGPGGLAGALGPQGLTGLAGAIGALGPQGLAGLAGAIGAAGPVGPQGPAGPQGPPGPEFSVCDCCVSPMQNVLEQLIGVTVILSTVADAPNVQPLLTNVTINEVNDFLVTVVDEATNTTSIVSIADVTAVLFSPGTEITLDAPMNFPGECDCRERPLRELFDTLVNTTVSFRSNTGGMAENFNLERTGLGIIFGQLDIGGGTFVNAAISICQITQVNP